MLDLDIWLRRLPGRFRSIHLTTGKIDRVDCAGVGSGPGVQCVS
jgi:hypothetical protein